MAPNNRFQTSTLSEMRAEIKQLRRDFVGSQKARPVTVERISPAGNFPVNPVVGQNVIDPTSTQWVYGVDETWHKLGDTFPTALLTCATGPPSSPIIFSNALEQASFNYDPVGFTYGNESKWILIPILHFGAGFFITNMGNPTVATIDTTNRAYFVVVHYYIWKDDFTVRMMLTQTALSGRGPGQTISASHNGMVINYNVGGDLTYSSPFWQVKTTAGGNFGQAMQVTAGWF